MTEKQKREWAARQNEVRRIVDANGWQAVRQHPEFGTLWAACLEDSRRFADAADRGN